MAPSGLPVLIVYVPTEQLGGTSHNGWWKFALKVQRVAKKLHRNGHIIFPEKGAMHFKL